VNAHTLSIAYRATGLAVLFVLSLVATRVYALAVLAPLVGRHGGGRAQGTITAVRPRTPGSRYEFPQVRFAADGSMITYQDRDGTPRKAGHQVQVRYNRRWPRQTATISTERRVWLNIARASWLIVVPWAVTGLLTWYLIIDL
jgi:hypothetical protein